MTAMAAYDVIIVGAGIAGAGLAAEVAPHARVLLLEMEDQPGRHATGRSAAFWSETYGGPAIQPLTTASQAPLDAGGWLQPLGAIQIGREEDRAQRDAFIDRFADSGIALEPINPQGIIPGLRADWTVGVREPSCAYIDVAGLHADFLGRARRAGAVIETRSALESASRGDDGLWHVVTRAGRASAPILANAAGAWADDVAARSGIAPIGITPYRRTLVQLDVDPPVPDATPHVASLGGSFYFKPEAGGKLWLSPHDETPSAAVDAAPEELDIAIAIDRLESVVDWRIKRVERAWAGLRSFAADRLPVYGYCDDAPGFFWCCGQGGFGIQTAPAASAIAGALLRNAPLPDWVAHIDPTPYAPARLR